MNQQEFTEWFCKNYPQDTLIHDPAWHAPRIYRAVAPAPEYTQADCGCAPDSACDICQGRPAPSERKPVAWSVWMNFDGVMRPTGPVFFEEEGAQRQQAIYGGAVVPLYR